MAQQTNIFLYNIVVVVGVVVDLVSACVKQNSVLLNVQYTAFCVTAFHLICILHDSQPASEPLRFSKTYSYFLIFTVREQPAIGDTLDVGCAENNIGKCCTVNGQASV